MKQEIGAAAVTMSGPKDSGGRAVQGGRAAPTARVQPMQKATTEQIIQAYRETGTVWAAAKRLGMCGQSVWERLRAIDYPMAGRNLTQAEVDEMRALAEQGCPIGEIARRLGRPYGGVATKLSSLGVRIKRQRISKLPRGAGFDKDTIRRRVAELEKYSGSVWKFCRSQGLHLDPFIKAVQRHFPDRWDSYVKTHAVLPPRRCDYCEAEFYPMSAKQRCCNRRCQAHCRADRSYFGGNRRHAIGLSQGICQLCEEPKERLAVHHVLGKQNDPENVYLIAVCNGCHGLIGTLASRKFAERPEALENLVSLALMRRIGDLQDPRKAGVHVWVDVEYLTTQDLLDDQEMAEQAVNS